MSTRYTSGGKRRSSMTHANRAHTCSCGKTVHGNGGKSGHRRACDGSWLSTAEAYKRRMQINPELDDPRPPMLVAAWLWREMLRDSGGDAEAVHSEARKFGFSGVVITDA